LLLRLFLQILGIRQIRWIKKPDPGLRPKGRLDLDGKRSRAASEIINILFRCMYETRGWETSSRGSHIGSLVRQNH